MFIGLMQYNKNWPQKQANFTGI